MRGRVGRRKSRAPNYTPTNQPKQNNDSKRLQNSIYSTKFSSSSLFFVLLFSFIPIKRKQEKERKKKKGSDATSGCRQREKTKYYTGHAVDKPKQTKPNTIRNPFPPHPTPKTGGCSDFFSESLPESLSFFAVVVSIFFVVFIVVGSFSPCLHYHRRLSKKIPPVIQTRSWQERVTSSTPPPRLIYSKQPCYNLSYAFLSILRSGAHMACACVQYA